MPAVGYNMVLAGIFAQAMSATFSISSSIVSMYQESIGKKIHTGKIFFFGLLGALVVNLAGNLHTIYVFTSGYENEHPVPFWNIMLPLKNIFGFAADEITRFSWFHASTYWYPNATRFIPYTIHEFPSYSYVVADLHGHVFDIPFVLLTISVMFSLFMVLKQVVQTRPLSRGKKKPPPVF